MSASGCATAFEWGGAAPRAAAIHELFPGAAAAAPVDTADQQTRLAALERDAFGKGYAQGERAGLEAGGQRADAMLRRLAQTLEELGTLRRAMIHQTERQMVQLALAIARRIVQREVSLDQDFVVAMARVALDRLGENAPATIRLHPDDFTSVMDRSGEGWAGAQVTVVPDAAISRGGCLVESEFGFVDAGVESQFQEIARALGDDQPAHAGVLGGRGFASASQEG